MSDSFPTLAASSTTSVSRVILGPLTTTFTPPATCSQCIFDSISTPDSAGQQVTMGCNAYDGLEDVCISTDPGCMPTVENDGGLLDLADVNAPFFSPGVYCPRGWTTKTLVSTNQTTATTGFGTAVETLMPHETAALCCPSGFDFVYDTTATAGYCSSAVTNTAFQYKTCNYLTSSSGIFQNNDACIQTSCPMSTGHATALAEGVTVNINGTLSLASVAAFLVYAPTIQINWQPSDRSLFPLTSSATSTAASTSSSATASQSAASSPPSSPAAVIAGVTVAAVVVIAGLVGLVLFWRWRRRRARLNEPEPAGKPELDGNGSKDSNGSSDVGSNAGVQSELPGQGPGTWYEMHGESAAIHGELAANWPAAVEAPASGGAAELAEGPAAADMVEQKVLRTGTRYRGSAPASRSSHQ